MKMPLSVASVTFLVAVNQTETNCLMTARTPPLAPGILHNQSDYIHVGKCDYGALDFNITTASESIRICYYVVCCCCFYNVSSVYTHY